MSFVVLVLGDPGKRVQEVTCCLCAHSHLHDACVAEPSPQHVAAGDTNMRTLQKGDILQLERKGYFIVDEPLTKPGKPMMLFCIPDGRGKSMNAPKHSNV